MRHHFARYVRQPHIRCPLYAPSLRYEIARYIIKAEATYALDSSALTWLRMATWSNRPVARYIMQRNITKAEIALREAKAATRCNTSGVRQRSVLKDDATGAITACIIDDSHVMDTALVL